MQAAFETNIERPPQLHLQRIIANRSSAAGLELKPHEAEALAKHLMAGNDGPLQLDERPGMTEATLTLTAEDGAELAALGGRIAATDFASRQSKAVRHRTTPLHWGQALLVRGSR